MTPDLFINNVQHRQHLLHISLQERCFIVKLGVCIARDKKLLTKLSSSIWSIWVLCIGCIVFHPVVHVFLLFPFWIEKMRVREAKHLAESPICKLDGARMRWTMTMGCEWMPHFLLIQPLREVRFHIQIGNRAFKKEYKAHALKY